MRPIDLIATARDLIPVGRGAPRESNLRRAISTAYYALFHCLAATCADAMVGSAARSTDGWYRTYRALGHGTAKNQCRDQTGIAAFPLSTIGAFADLFVSLQEERHRADYAPNERLSKAVVVQSIDQAEDVILALEGEGLQTRRAFAAYVLFRSR